jgi:hypothetical protein
MSGDFSTKTSPESYSFPTTSEHRITEQKDVDLTKDNPLNIEYLSILPKKRAPQPINNNNI